MKIAPFTSKFFIGVIIAVVQVGCVTTSSMRPESESLVIRQVALQPLFAECIPGDGAAQFSLRGEGRNFNGIEVIWNFKSKDYWDIQFNSPLGDTLVNFLRRNNALELKGIGERDVALGRDGFLTIDKHQLPIKDSELSCLLSGRWSTHWLQFLREERSQSNPRQILNGNDGVRTVHLESKISTDGKNIQSCANISWGGFLGLFTNKSQICIMRSSGSVYSVELKGPSDYEIKWWVSSDTK